MICRKELVHSRPPRCRFFRLLTRLEPSFTTQSGLSSRTASPQIGFLEADVDRRRSIHMFRMTATRTLLPFAADAPMAASARSDDYVILDFLLPRAKKRASPLQFEDLRLS